jgi:hypothetical protein
MKPSEKSDFAKLITDVLGYYRQDASSFTLSLWWQACQGFEMEQVSKALSGHAMDAERGVYAPKVADGVRVLAGTMADRAALAWGKVLGAMSAVGAYSDVVFDDPAIHAAIHAAIEDLGGWVKVCRGETAELSYLQHRFCQLHKAYTAQGTFEYQRRLIGERSPDSDFVRHGLALPRPAIGQAARRVQHGAVPCVEWPGCLSRQKRCCACAACLNCGGHGMFDFRQG